MRASPVHVLNLLVILGIWVLIIAVIVTVVVLIVRAVKKRDQRHKEILDALNRRE